MIVYFNFIVEITITCYHTNMNDFANTLERLYGANSPILLDEIKEAFPNTPPATLYRRLRSAIASSKLAKARKGVYYVPTETRFG